MYDVKIMSCLVLYSLALMHGLYIIWPMYFLFIKSTRYLYFLYYIYVYINVCSYYVYCFHNLCMKSGSNLYILKYILLILLSNLLYGMVIIYCTKVNFCKIYALCPPIQQGDTPIVLEED